MCTAGPQPGTCPAQRAPLDLNGQIECQKICQIECQMECPGGHHSLQAKGSAAGAAQTRQHSFCCASDRHFSKMATFLQQVCKLFSKIGSYCPQLQIVGQKQRSQPALHSIIQVAIPTVLMDLGGRLRATCCMQATIASDDAFHIPGGHHSLKAKGSAAGAAQKRQHSFCCASDRHLPEMATPLQQVSKLFSKIGYNLLSKWNEPPSRRILSAYQVTTGWGAHCIQLMRDL